MKRFLFIVISALMCNVTCAETFNALGESFSYELPEGLCVLNEDDPVENAILKKTKATTPQADIPVVFTDCISIKKVKSGKTIRHFYILGAIKTLKDRFPISNNEFLTEMVKRFNIDSAELSRQVDQNMKRGIKDAEIDADISNNGTKFLGTDENTIYMAGSAAYNDFETQYISAFTLNKEVVLNFEVFTYEKAMDLDDVLDLIIDLKEGL